MKNIINNKKVLQIVLIAMFFALFLNNSMPVAFADDDYGSYGNVGGYGSYGNVGGYSYPSIGYTNYSYPGISYPGTYNYPGFLIQQ